MSRKLYLAWQDPKTGLWFTVGRLTSNGYYEFVYTRGAEEAAAKAGFQPLMAFPNLQKTYRSEDLFPPFANRVPSPSRPDYAEFLQRLNLEVAELQQPDRDLLLLSRSGGRRATDSFEVYPCPEPDEDGRCELYFFVHGLRYMPDESMRRVKQLEVGEQLFMALDFQNPVDHLALLLRTKDAHLVGFCPRYLLPDIHRVLKRFPDIPKVTVARINRAPAPRQSRILCRLTASWPDEYKPCTSESHQPIGSGRVVEPS